MKHLVVFASGSGSNFQSIIDAIEDGRLDAKITGLISNKEHIGAIERARQHNIPTAVIHPNNYDDRSNYITALKDQLAMWSPDLIILAGYLLKIPKEIIEMYPERILNIHPSLLPAFGGKGFYGKKVHQAVLNAGEKISGCSVHIVTEEFDEGPVIAQRQVNVKRDDTAESLASRILKEEHKLYPAAIDHYLRENINKNT